MMIGSIRFKFIRGFINVEKMSMTNKEFQMMEMMMMNLHNVISADHFLGKVWGYDSDVEINVVWVYISYLRKKLTALHADIQIKVQRNAGYSLEEM